MADKRTFEVQVTGSDDGARKTLSDLEQMVGKFGKTTEESSKVVNAGVTTAAAAVVKFGKDSVSTYVDATRESMTLARQTGETVEQASKLRYAGEQTGVSVDDLSVAVKYLSKNMVANNAEFETLGVQVRNSDGSLRGIHDVLLDTADALSKMENGAAKNDAAGKLLGKSYEALMPLLNKGKDAILAFEQEAEKYGLTIGTDNVAAVQASVKAHREYDAAMQGLQIRIGEQVLPLQTMLVDKMAELPGPVMDAVGPVTALGAGFFALAGPLASAGDVLGPVVSKLKTMSAQAKDGGAETMSMSQKAAQGFAALGVVIGGATVAYGIWSAALKEADRNFDAAMGPAKQKATTASMSETVAMLGRAKGSIDDMTASMNNSRAPWDRDYRAEMEAGIDKQQVFVDQLHRNINTAEVLSDVTGDNTDRTLAWVNAQEAAGITFSSNDGAIAAYTGEIDKSTISSEDAAAAIKAQDDALKNLNDTLHAAADPLFGMLNAQDKLNDAQLKSAEANNAQAAAQAAYDAEVRKHGPNSKYAKLLAFDLADATNKAADANRNAAGSALDLQTSVNTLNEKLKTQPELLDSAKQMLANWQQQGWLTQQQADTMRRQFDDTAYSAMALGQYKPNVQVTADVSQAIASLKNLIAYMDAVRGTRITATARDNDGRISMQAAGTNALRDGDHIFNEAGAEIIRKHGSSVEIIPAGKSAQAMRSATPSAGGDTHYHQHVTIMGSLVTERELSGHLNDLQGRGQTMPWSEG